MKIKKTTRGGGGGYHSGLQFGSGLLWYYWYFVVNIAERDLRAAVATFFITPPEPRALGLK